MTKKLYLIIGAIVAFVSAVLALTLVAGIGIVAVSAGSSSAGGVAAAISGRGAAAVSCTVALPGSPADTATGEGAYDAAQIAIIQQIVGVGKSANIPEKGWIVALIVAMQESGIRSLDGGDRDSIGLMQQRPSMAWGSPAQLKDPVYAIQAFYLGANGNGNPGLMSVPNWDTMVPTAAAQAVQRSGFPEAYQKHFGEATRLIEKYKSAPPVPLLTTSPVNSSPGNANVTPGDSTNCAGGGGTPGSIAAAGDDYPGRNWVPDQGSVAGGYARECVDFAAWRMRQHSKTFDPSRPLEGKRFVLGNGAQWGPSARALGYEVDMNPRAGDIAYWTGPGAAGHVAFVTEVKGDGTISLEEYNWAIPGGGGASDYSYHTRTISASEPSGFIHFIGNPLLDKL